MGLEAIMQAIRSTERFSDPMEHRWGQRITFEVPVKLAVGGRTLGRGVLRNASISGALIETPLELPVFSNLEVSMPATGDRSFRECDLAASVVRCEPGRLAVEWRDMACPSIVALLERVTRKRVAALVEDESFSAGRKHC
jgi:PilZ domain-containing protein